MICTCPAAGSLPTIPAATCPEDFGQTQKIAFQRLRKDDGTKNAFETASPIGTLASWTPLLSAEDSTKIVVTPYIQEPTSTPGSARTFGGGNQTPDGIEIILGRDPSTFTSYLRSIPQNVIKALKELQCEAQADNLGVFLFNGNGQIGAIKGTESDEYYPIPIRSLFIGDKGLGGFEAPDNNALNFSLLPNWSDDFVVVTPDFNPLTDLVAES